MSTNPSTRGKELFESGYFCAESTLLAISEELGIQSKWIPRISTGFCAGIARTCQQCGAVSGAIMGLGLASGRDKPTESVEGLYQQVRTFLVGFTAKYQSTNCLDLTGIDLGTEAGQIRFIEENKREYCAQLTQDAVDMALSIIRN